MAQHRTGLCPAWCCGSGRHNTPFRADVWPEKKHHDREVYACECASHRGRPGNGALILPHCKHGNSDEKKRARQIAEQVSSVSSQASLRHLSAECGRRSGIGTNFPFWPRPAAALQCATDADRPEAVVHRVQHERTAPSTAKWSLRISQCRGANGQSGRALGYVRRRY